MPKVTHATHVAYPTQNHTPSRSALHHLHFTT